MATGQIKRPVHDRSYRFIQPMAADEEILFYRSTVEDDALDLLQVGQRVEFDQEPDPSEPRRNHPCPDVGTHQLNDGARQMKTWT